MRLRFAGAGRSFEAIAVDGRLRVLQDAGQQCLGHPTFTMLAPTSPTMVKWVRRRRLQMAAAVHVRRAQVLARHRLVHAVPARAQRVVVPQDVVAHAETGQRHWLPKAVLAASHDSKERCRPRICPVKSAMLLWLLCVGTTTRV